MEILIDVPPFLHPYIEWLLLWGGNIVTWLIETWGSTCSAWTVFTASLAQVLDIPRNALVPILGALFFFWPILLSLIMAIATASTWIFWLFTGMIVGLAQVVYVSYHFFMIAADVVGLSFLKTYSMIRHQFLIVLDKAGSTSRKSKRRVWQQQLAQCEGYEDYMRIRLHAKEIPKVQLNDGSRSKTKDDESDAALPPLNVSSCASNNSSSMKRNLSFTSRSSSENRSSPLRRSQSFNDRKSVPDLEADPVVRQELGEKLADLVVQTTERLKEARLAQQKKASSPNSSSTTTTTAKEKTSLAYLLSGVVKRNHLQLDDCIIDNARNVAERGQYGLTAPTRTVIRDYVHQVEQGLDWIAEAPTANDQQQQQSQHQTSMMLDDDAKSTTSASYYRNELVERLTLVRKMKQNMGRTALMLSGGGAQAMYHIGIIRGLLESKQYRDLKVISGTSGGSIIAAMCAMKNEEEMYHEICIPTVVSDYKKNGEQKKENIRWFPPLTEMVTYWLKHKLLVDSAYFRRTCEFYYSDTTFEEAFEKTGKHVCITVSASRATGGTVQRLLLNHISTPHVTIASAVAASCALPGVMKPAKLLAKNNAGELEPFEIDGVEWIDGSIQADLPFQRISTLFAVSSFIVSQTNFHVLPFLNKEYHPTKKSLYWKLFSSIEWDIRSRALKLSKLGLFPRMFGQDISKIFEQQYHGNLTIVPRFTTMQTFGLKSLSNPTEADMESYIKYGQIAAWPYLNAIRDLMRLEKALDDCLHRLEDRARALNEDWLIDNDDVESIASSSAANHSSARGVRIVGRPPYGMRSTGAISVESDRVKTLERENTRLLRELEQLKAQMVKESSEPSTPVSRGGSGDSPAALETVFSTDSETTETTPAMPSVRSLTDSRSSDRKSKIERSKTASESTFKTSNARAATKVAAAPAPSSIFAELSKPTAALTGNEQQPKPTESRSIDTAKMPQIKPKSTAPRLADSKQGPARLGASKPDTGSSATSLSDGSEGKVWNLIKSSAIKPSTALNAITSTLSSSASNPLASSKTKIKKTDKELTEIEKARLYASTLLAEDEKPTLGGWLSKQKEKIQQIVEGED